VGDELWITGPVGAAMLGLEALRIGTGNSLAYRRPQALLDEGRALAPHVTAMMDVSDGLLLDAARLARASGVALAIDSLSVPLAVPEARRAEALRWGEDYQLLFTAPQGTLPPVAAWRIGEALATGDSPILLDGAGLCEADGLGYRHNQG
jgi:thiamine-monophosphate kinase